MRILYAGMKFDYGKPAQGLSFEHWTFFETFRNMGIDIIYFDFMMLMEKYGREKMNRLLLETVNAEKPDLLFSILFRDEFKQETIRKISRDQNTCTVNWFCDDHWRFENYSQKWAPCFNWVITTAQSALPKYERIGFRNVIKSQWACNHFIYKKLDLPLKYDVTFVGQPHGNRPQIIQALRKAGINIQVWGQGWENGRLSQDNMIHVFNQSRINLNLNNSSTYNGNLFENFKNKSIYSIKQHMEKTPYGEMIYSSMRKFFHHIREDAYVDGIPIVNLNNAINVEQIKGRNFEVPGCGGFILSGPAENLGEYYQSSKEIIFYESVQNLIDQVKYYLLHEEERTLIAQNGYKRTIKDHTYSHRFQEIFTRVGLVAQFSNPSTNPGETLEIR